MSDQAMGESNSTQGGSNDDERSRADTGRRDLVLRMSRYHPIAHFTLDEGW
jgi:hypothetical protein